MEIEKGIYLARDKTGIPLCWRTDEAICRVLSSGCVLFFVFIFFFPCVSGTRLS